MGQTICKIDGRYFLYSAVADAPITILMTQKELTEFYGYEYGARSLKDLPDRIARADEKGTSNMLYASIEHEIACNRYGENEENLSFTDFKNKLIQESDKLRI